MIHDSEYSGVNKHAHPISHLICVVECSCLRATSLCADLYTILAVLSCTDSKKSASNYSTSAHAKSE